MLVSILLLLWGRGKIKKRRFFFFVHPPLLSNFCYSEALGKTLHEFTGLKKEIILVVKIELKESDAALSLLHT